MIRLFMTVFSGITCGSIPAGNGLFPTKLYDHGTYCLWSLRFFVGGRTFFGRSPPRALNTQLESYRFSFITAIIATKMFLASPAVIAALIGLKPAL
jgi:hypothetical protein